MTSIEKLPMNISARDMRFKIIECSHSLKTFINRLDLLGCGDADGILLSLITEIHREPEYGPDEMSEGAYGASLRAAFYNAVRNGLSDIAVFAGKQAKAPPFTRWIRRLIKTVSKSIKKQKNTMAKTHGRKRK